MKTNFQHPIPQTAVFFESICTSLGQRSMFVNTRADDESTDLSDLQWENILEAMDRSDLQSIYHHNEETEEA